MKYDTRCKNSTRCREPKCNIETCLWFFAASSCNSQSSGCISGMKSGNGFDESNFVGNSQRMKTMKRNNDKRAGLRKVNALVGHCCDFCFGEGNYECELSGCTRVCPECHGTGVIEDEDYYEPMDDATRYALGSM